MTAIPFRTYAAGRLRQAAEPLLLPHEKGTLDVRPSPFDPDGLIFAAGGYHTMLAVHRVEHTDKTDTWPTLARGALDAIRSPFNQGREALTYPDSCANVASILETVLRSANRAVPSFEPTTTDFPLSRAALAAQRQSFLVNHMIALLGSGV